MLHPGFWSLPPTLPHPDTTTLLRKESETHPPCDQGWQLLWCDWVPSQGLPAFPRQLQQWPWGLLGAEHLTPSPVNLTTVLEGRFQVRKLKPRAARSLLKFIQLDCGWARFEPDLSDFVFFLASCPPKSLLLQNSAFQIPGTRDRAWQPPPSPHQSHHQWEWIFL